MILPDVNVLVYAYRADGENHERYREWLHAAATGIEPLALTDSVLSGFVRIVTHPRIYSSPDSTGDALDFVQALRDQPSARALSPGERHWSIFDELCRRVGAKGNVVPDALLAALAIEAGCEVVTADRGFGRFPGLRWRHPLDSSSA